MGTTSASVAAGTSVAGLNDTSAYLLRRLQEINSFFTTSIQSMRTPTEILVKGAELSPDEIDEIAVLEAVAAAEAEAVTELVSDILTEQLAVASVETILANDPPPQVDEDLLTSNENGQTQADGNLPWSDQ
jgi:hypothetical protein